MVMDAQEVVGRAGLEGATPAVKRVKVEGEAETAKQEALGPLTDQSVSPSPPVSVGTPALSGTLWSGAEVKVHEWQLFSPRLCAILQMEKEDKTLSAAEAQEKNTLFAESFPLWERDEFRIFIQTCAEKGRTALTDITEQLPNKTVDEVSKYAQALWARGPECFQAETWGKLIKFVEEGEAKLSHVESTIEIVRQKLEQETGGNNRKLELHKSLDENRGREFCPEEDRFLLTCFLLRKNKEEIRRSLLSSPEFAFDHFFRSLSPDELQKRLVLLVQLVQKDMEEWNKAEAKASRDKERKDQEDASLLKREQELLAKIEETERQMMKGLSTPGSPVGNGGEHVFPLSPTGGEADGESDGGHGGVTTGSLDPKYHDSVIKMVVASGTCGMAQLVDKVTKMLPEGAISKRQLKRDIAKLAVKEKRIGDRAARWYAREVPQQESSS